MKLHISPFVQLLKLQEKTIKNTIFEQTQGPKSNLLKDRYLWQITSFSASIPS